MDPFEQMRTLAELWGQSGKAFLSAQHSAVTDMAERLRKVGQGQSLEAAFAPGKEGAELAAAQKSFGEMWSAATALSGTITSALRTGDAPDPMVGEMLSRIFDPRHWFAAGDDMDDALNRFADGPRLADLWNVERRTVALYNAWIALRRRNTEHNTLMLRTWMRAAEAFAKDLNQRADRGEALTSWREVIALWVETANTTLLEAQRSEEFLLSQRAVLQASAELRLAQQDIGTFYSEMFGYPTRGELDEVHKTVTELRREVRALKRELRSVRGGSR